MEKQYTLKEIKEAFAKTFLHAGELWFDYSIDDQGNKPGFESIADWWEDFEGNLLMHDQGVE